MCPLVSIIIPVYKAEAFLAKCIESCCNQTYQNIEIILVNDGSPDNCAKICDDYAQTDSRIKVIHKENTGVSDTRNIGIQNATGDFIMFVDSDDWVEPDMIHEMVSFQSDNNLDFIIAGMTLYKNGEYRSTIIPEKMILENPHSVAKHLAIATNIKFYRPPVVKLFKRSLLISHKIAYDINLKINEDFIFVLEYLKVCTTVGTMNKAFYNYNQIFSSEKSIHYDYGNATKQWDLNLMQYQIYKNFFTASNTYEENKASINTYFIARIRGFLTSVILAGGNKHEILSILKKIPSLSEYQDVKSLKMKYISSYIEKLILFCCKNKLWHFLYFCFRCKNTLYNKRVYTNP